MEPVLGKLKSLDAGDELGFSINPTDFRLTRNLNFNVEPCLGQAGSVVAFKSGGTTELSFHLVFDSDIDKNFEIRKLDSFLKGLNKINSDTKSVTLVEFVMGQFVFRGFTKAYLYNPCRFDSKGNATSVKIDFTLISNGDYENGKL